MQETDNLGMPIFQGEIDGSFSILSSDINFRTVGEQQIDHLGLAILGGSVQWDESIGLDRIGVCAMSQESPGNFQLSGGGR